MRLAFVFLVSVFGLSSLQWSCAYAADAMTVADPLKSPMWGQMSAQFFGDAPVVFDDRVKVLVPSITENQAQVAVTVDARAIDGVQKVVVFADLNPIQHVLTLRPSQAAPYISFRMKVEQATPVRAAALTTDGKWHVGGIFLEAAGGGCTAPALARGQQDWTDTLGQAQGRVWRQLDGTTRARFRVRHPMDTGLAKDNTPAYYIDNVDLRGSGGTPLATVDLFEPVSEDPTLTLMVRLPSSDTELQILGRDNNGGRYSSAMAVPRRDSSNSAPDTKRQSP